MNNPDAKYLHFAKKRTQLIDRLLAVFAIATILAAYIFGLSQSKSDVMTDFQKLMPSAQRFAKLSDNVYVAYQNEQLIGYVALNEATGYGGPVEVAVAVTPQGKVQDFNILYNYETYEYFVRVEESGLPESLIGKSCQDPFRLKQDVDGVTGATYTSEGIAKAVGNACHDVIASGLGGGNSTAGNQKIQFGAPEIALLGLFTIGFYSHRAKFKFTKQARWVSMILGLLILGFWLNRPLTIGNINQLLMGFWPAWQSHLYWYLLVGGVLLVSAIDNKNPYCDWFCPFGATQECLGVVGKAKVQSAGRYKGFLKWLQRGFAWLAIVLALIFRNPTLTSYEVFGTLFSRIGTSVSFALLGIVLIASLFIKRPWCNYLCPLRPVTDAISMLRRWVLDTWNKNVG